jgi:hypothetical protein
MCWITEKIGEILKTIKLNEYKTETQALKLPIGAWKLYNVKNEPSMDYKRSTFDLIINFGSVEKRESLYPSIERELNTTFALIQDLPDEPKDGFLTKTMTITLKREV